MSKQFDKKPQETLDEHVAHSFEGTIAVACYDSPSLIQCGASLSEAAIEDVMTSIYDGDDKNGAPDPDMITYVEQFMLGLNKFKGLYKQELLQTGSNGASGEVLLIPEFLQHHKNLLVYVGDGSIEKAMLSQSQSLRRVARRFQGEHWFDCPRQLHAKLQENEGPCESKRSPYRDGKFPSGTNWEDYILWCLVEMGRECYRDDAAKMDSVANKADAGFCGLGEVEAQQGQGILLPSSSLVLWVFYPFTTVQACSMICYLAMPRSAHWLEERLRRERKCASC